MSREENKTAPKQRNDMRTKSDAVTTKDVDMASMWANVVHTATETMRKGLEAYHRGQTITDRQSKQQKAEAELEEKRKQHIENSFKTTESKRKSSAKSRSSVDVDPVKLATVTLEMDSDKSAQDIARLNDELITAKLQSKLEIYGLKDELETARDKSAQDIARLNDELIIAKLQSKREIYGLKAELETARDKSAQDIARLNDELKTAKLQSKREIYGLKAELETARMQSKQEIDGLKAELETVKLSEQKWMDKVKQLGNNSERSKSAQDGRPDIQDLSDSNRPSKLAERFSELYDDEWINCYETARKQFSTEQSAVQMLLRTCVKIYNSCTFIASKDVHDLQRAFSTFSEAQDDVLLIQMKQRRKRPRQVDIDIKRITPDIGDSVADMLGPDLIKNQHVRAFWVKCLEICWLLVIQDPPVYMDTAISKQGQMFDHAAYRPYTQTGYEFDFVVWPALYIHHGGDILYKGVAQGKDSSDSVGGKRRSNLVKK